MISANSYINIKLINEPGKKDYDATIETPVFKLTRLLCCT